MAQLRKPLNYFFLEAKSITFFYLDRDLAVHFSLLALSLVNTISTIVLAWRLAIRRLQFIQLRFARESSLRFYGALIMKRSYPVRPLCHRLMITDYFSCSEWFNASREWCKSVKGLKELNRKRLCFIVAKLRGLVY